VFLTTVDVFRRISLFSSYEPPGSLYLNNEGLHQIQLLEGHQWDVFNTFYLGHFIFSCVLRLKLLYSSVYRVYLIICKFNPDKPQLRLKLSPSQAVTHSLDSASWFQNPEPSKARPKPWL